jgi:hypothetical protein
MIAIDEHDIKELVADPSLETIQPRVLLPILKLGEHRRLVNQIHRYRPHEPRVHTTQRLGLHNERPTMPSSYL